MIFLMEGGLMKKITFFQAYKHHKHIRMFQCFKKPQNYKQDI